MYPALSILIVRKRTKWERDLIHYGSETTARKIYQCQNNAYEHVFTAHIRAKTNFEKIQAHLKGALFILRAELPFLDCSQFDLIVSFGGDNHFVYVSRFASQTPILGLNSDPETSTGALLYFTSTNFIEKITPYLNQKNDLPLRDCLTLEQWTRIEGELKFPDRKDKIKIGPCVSEISVRSSFHDYISRFLVRKNKESWEGLKCSGLLLVCGAGSTGWYRNGHWDGTRAAFAKDAPFFRSLARETNYVQRKTQHYLNPEVRLGERLEIISEMEGEITLDADPEQTFPFPPGALASFFLSEQKLNVVHGLA